jgi:hypothetical protein
MNSTNIRAKSFKKHYIKYWLVLHPDAISYKKLMHYIEHGDEFGRKVPIDVLADLCKTTKTTILKWLPIIKDEIAKKNV